MAAFLGGVCAPAQTLDRDYILNQIRNSFRDLGLDLQASRFDYNVFEFSGTFRNVVLRATAAPQLPPLLRADEVRVNLGLVQFIEGNFLIQQATLTNPAVRIVITPDGKSNLPQGGKSGGGGTLTIEDLRAHNGSLRVEDGRQNLAVVLPQWSLALQGQQGNAVYQARLDTQKPGSATLAGNALTIGSLSTSAGFNRNTGALAFNDLTLVTGAARVAARGSVGRVAAPVLDLKLNGSVDLAQLVRFAGLQEPVAGQVAFSATATGPLKQARVDAQIQGSGLDAAGVRGITMSAQAEYQSGTDRLRLAGFSVQAPPGNVQGRANLALSAQAGQSTLEANLQGVDLLAAARALKLPVRLASRATGTVTAQWPGVAFKQASATAKLDLRSTRELPARDVLPVTAALDLDYRRNRLALTVRSLHTLAANGWGTVLLANLRRLGGRMHLETNDLSDVMRRLNRYLGKSAAPSDVQIGGPLSVVVDLGGTVQKPRLEARIDSAGLQVGAVRGVTLRARAVYDSGLLTITESDVRWREQALLASGTVELTGRKALDLNVRILAASVPAALQAAGITTIPAQGTFAGTAHVFGTLDNPEARLDAAAQNLEAYGEPLGDMTLSATLAGHVIQVSTLRLAKSTGGVLEASGLYNTATEAYSFSARIADFEIQHLQLPGGVILRGDVNLAASGQGAASNPALSAQLSVQNLNVGGQAAGALTATVNVANQTAVFRMQAPAFELAASGRVGIRAPYPATLQVVARATDLAKLPLNIQPPLAGFITATVDATGDLQNWKQGQAAANIQQLSVEWNGVPVRSTGLIHAVYGGGLLNVTPTEILAAGSRVRIGGTLALEPAAGASDFEVLAKLELQNLSRWISGMPPARGELTVNAVLRGSLQNLEPAADIALRNGYLEPPAPLPPLSNVQADLEMRQGAVLLPRFTADWGGAAVTAQGEVPLGILPANLPVAFARRQGPASLTLDVTGFRLSALKTAPEDVHGAAGVHVDLRAPRLALDALDGRVVFNQLELGVGTITLRQPAPSVIAISNGMARFQQFALTGADTSFQVSGTAQLAPPQNLNLTVSGNLDAAILAAFSNQVKAEGPTQLQLALGGSMANPRMTGFVQIERGQFAMTSPTVLLEDFTLRLDIANNQVTITTLKGVLNGGALQGGGAFTFSGAGLTNVNIVAKADDVYMDYPPGLKTVSDLVLTAQSRGPNIVLGGQVTILDGTYTDQISLEGGLAQAIRSGSPMQFTGTPNPFLSRLRFSLGVTSQSPLVVNNNLAKAAVDMQVRLLGSYYHPGLTGRVQVEEGGEVYFNERTYIVDRAIITLLSQNRIEPSFDLLARAQAGGYDISLQLQGEPGKLQTTLTSDPPLSETDIIAVLLTGRPLNEVRGSELNIASQEAFSYVAGRLGASLAQEARRTLGLTTLRIEPSLIAPEANPTARLTVGQQLNRKLDLIYSIDLVNSGNQIWIGEYNLTRRFVTRAIKQQDNSYRLEFRHDYQFGGPRARAFRARLENRKIAGVTFNGGTGFTSRQLAKHFSVKVGDRYDFFKIHGAVEKLQSFFARDDLLENRVRLSRDIVGNQVFLRVDIRSGPRVQLVYEGWSPPRGLKKKVRTIWQNGVFDAQRLTDAEGAIRAALVEDHHYQGEVKPAITTPQPDVKRVLFDINPGVRYQRVEVAFQGVTAFEPKELRDLLKDQHLSADVYVDYRKVRDFLTRYYQEHGYLDAQVADRRFDFNPAARTGSVVIPVNQGPRYLTGQVRFTGNHAFTAQELRVQLPLTTGAPYAPPEQADSYTRLQELYWRKGFSSVEITYTLAKNPAEHTVDVNFGITENKQQVVESIEVAGTDQTSPSFVKAQMPIQAGKVLDYREMNKARSNLYSTGAYNLVELNTPPAPPRPGLLPEQRPVRLLVRVDEVKPFRLLYGGFYDTDRGPGGIVDFSNRNTLGDARVLGMRTRYDSQFKEARLYYSQPLLRSFPLRTTATTYLNREIQSDFVTDRVGFTTEQETRFRDHYFLTYGYRLERTHTYDRVPNPDFPFDVVGRIAPLTATLTRDTRDDLLDATRGSFASQAGEWAPSLLGSELQYARYFGQYFRYFPLSRPTPIPMLHGARKPRLIYATGVRIGLGGGLSGQELVPSERFFAGGGTTIRGFKQDQVGPQIGGVPVGGNAVLILNNEIRFPLKSIFDGVGFIDAGNVYRRAGDFNPTDLRAGAGVGLRVRTPYVLLRLDWGMKLDRRTGESIGALFFSIGQAF